MIHHSTWNHSLQATVEMEICVKLCGLRPGSPLVLINDEQYEQTWMSTGCHGQATTYLECIGLRWKPWSKFERQFFGFQTFSPARWWWWFYSRCRFSHDSCCTMMTANTRAPRRSAIDLTLLILKSESRKVQIDVIVFKFLHWPQWLTTRSC